ncbi:hypothetical protein CEXT_450871 [Caerostris extrusa]|uniref:Uncharacterized protein n=1 Tax=Caerostris extrusa TaxID=172846 RepID=A0AAV4QIH0_CAEEX|nr:hypothetical protein CEXT_450871 [Caerostris extrusa]
MSIVLGSSYLEGMVGFVVEIFPATPLNGIRRDSYSVCRHKAFQGPPTLSRECHFRSYVASEWHFATRTLLNCSLNFRTKDDPRRYRSFLLFFFFGSSSLLFIVPCFRPGGILTVLRASSNQAKRPANRG